MDPSIRSRMEKIKRMIEHPSTPPGQREAALNRLQAMRDKYGSEERIGRHAGDFGNGGDFGAAVFVDLGAAMQRAAAQRRCAADAMAYATEFVKSVQEEQIRAWEQEDRDTLHREALAREAEAAARWLNTTGDFKAERNHSGAERAVWTVWDDDWIQKLNDRQIVDLAREAGWTPPPSGRRRAG